MALITTEGFEAFVPNDRATYGRGGAVDAQTTQVSGRYGGSAFRVQRELHDISFPMPGPTGVADLTVGVAWKPVLYGSSSRSLLVFSGEVGSTSNLSFRVDILANLTGASRNLSIRLGGIGASVATGPDTLLLSAWQYIEVRVARAGASSTVTIWVNSRPYLTWTGTVTGSYTTVVYLGELYGNGAVSCDWYVDDFYALDPSGTRNTARLGDCYVETIAPTSTAAANTFTGLGAGTVHDCVDDTAQDGDSTYATSSATGGKLLLGFANNGTDEPAAIHGIEIVGVAKKAIDSSRVARALSQSGANSSAGAASPAALTNYRAVRGCIETRPGTSAPWTRATLNTAAFGIEIL